MFDGRDMIIKKERKKKAMWARSRLRVGRWAILYDFKNWQSMFSLERPEKPHITHPVLYFTSSVGNNEICSSWFVSVVYTIPGTVILGSVFQLEAFPLRDGVFNRTYIWKCMDFLLPGFDFSFLMQFHGSLWKQTKERRSSLLMLSKFAP